MIKHKTVSYGPRQNMATYMAEEIKLEIDADIIKRICNISGTQYTPKQTSSTKGYKISRRIYNYWDHSENFQRVY